MNYKTLLSGCTLLMLSGCVMVGPDYERPSVKLPTAFTEQRYSRATSNLRKWWTFFNDSYLNQLIEQALTNNFDLRIALEKIQQARNIYHIESAQQLPDIRISGQANRSKNTFGLFQTAQTTTTTKVSASNFFQLGFDALWEFDFWGKIQRSKNAALHDFEAQVESMRDVYIILLSDITKAYITIRSLQKKIDLLSSLIDIDTKFLNLTQDLFRSGIDSEIPVAQQQTTLEESKTLLLSLQSELKQTTTQLAVLLGENPEEFILNTNSHGVPQSTQKLEPGLPSDLLRRRPDIREAERKLAAATERIGQAIADYFPSFSLLANALPQANNVSHWFFNGGLAWLVGASVNCPFISFGRIKFNVEAKKSEQRQALLTYAQSVVNALGDVEQRLISYFSSADQIKTLTKKLSAATHMHNLVKSRFACGLDSELELLSAEKNQIEIEIQVTNAQQELSISLVAVYKALGGEW